ncbi:MAG: UbiD family decarboxylase, partial [Methanobacteriota archaeon]
MAIRTWLDRFGRDVVTVEGSVKRDLGATRHFLATPSRPVFLPNLEGGPAVANLWSTRERVAGALGIQPNEFLPKLLEAQAHPQDTRLVERAEFMTQATSDVDLTAMPIPKLFPKDAGRYITAG